MPSISKPNLRYSAMAAGFIGEHRQFDALDGRPVVAQVEHRLHQAAADAFTVVARIDADAEGGDVAAANALIQHHNQ